MINPRKLIIGIMGTTGSGKTTAASFFPKKNWKIINVDKIGHLLLRKNIVKKQILHAFGKKIVPQTDGQISRAELAKIVFVNKKIIKTLNKIMYPYLKQEVLQRLHTEKNVVIDCALLVPLGLTKRCTRILQIQAPAKIVFQRLAKRYTKKQQKFVMNQQQTSYTPDFLLLNDGTKKELKDKIKKIITFLYAA